MSCESFQDALIEAAASGEEPRGALLAHLKECQVCRAAFEQEQTLFATMDSGLRSIANPEVPPSLLPRVRAALDEMPGPAPAWSPKWFVLAGASAMLALVFVAQTVWRARFVPNAAQPVMSASREPSPSLHAAEEKPNMAATAHPNSPLPPVSAARVNLQRHSASNAEALPDVLVPRDQEILLAGYASEWAHMKAAPVLRAEANANEPALAPLEVAPIQIAELDVKLLAESDAQ